MVFEDDNGDRLSIPGDVTISVPPEALGNATTDEPIKVWTLNPTTGSWDESSDLVEETEEEEEAGGGSRRRKRQLSTISGTGRYTATIRGLSINARWYNFDSISRQTCIAKIRLFESDDYTQSNQLRTGAEVSMVFEDSNGFTTLSRNRVYVTVI